MEQGMTWVGVTCLVFILGCFWEATAAAHDVKPCLSPSLMDQHIQDIGDESLRKSQNLFKDKTEEEIDNNNGVTVDKTGHHKRVFLSRGWGPGGYEAPPPPPQRFVRRPPALHPPRAKIHEKPPTTAVGGNGGAWYAALVSPHRQEQIQQKPQYRQFHSIFTSGNWSPLGKRGGSINVIDAFENSLRKYKDNDKKWLGFLLDKEDDNVTTGEDKRSGVFVSSGWGAGGSSPVRHHTPRAA
ncbi:uncharacterized protein LOC121871830 isoform X2 [Homarus americanus]|uniref:uncharacterized protein LOC121871830 isoform X2 n=1 Tax=Homarus americanus TaxID=6706 RepID=UPI001C43FD07|nr:uncharacterized protein LOC121871830 isoform X2 [Homarus americanus]